MSINFERNLVSSESIPGTKMSAKGMQLMVSTGIPSVDRFLGGGLPLNSITLIGFQSNVFQFQYITKYFDVFLQKRTVLVNTRH